MLFNSYAFIFLFLPVVLFGFYWFGSRERQQSAIAWLVVASLFFYGWWNPIYLILIISSMVFNYTIGTAMLAQASKKRVLLLLGITVNLGLLGYFKYANFFVDSLNSLIGSSFALEKIVLPLAISFFTFQQITYLVDTYNLKGFYEQHFLHYALFVTFFPQLIAGPIVHHREMLPQFASDTPYRLKADRLAIGITIFAIGLFKKVILADGIAIYATPVFNAAKEGVALAFFEAWGGALAYSLQLYFDFSGYSDMAIGLGWMFGVRLPLNFNSPYKATSIISFWRRWHITLSRFLRDYLYIPLGGNRKGEVRRITNVMITMLLGGLWHGAGWIFVFWGGLHGIYLVINNVWRRLFPADSAGQFRKLFGWAITMLAVVVAWVPFRSENISAAGYILAGMGGFHGFVLPESYLGYLNHLAGLGDYLAGIGWKFENSLYFNGIKEVLALSSLLVVVTVLPNIQQLMYRYRLSFETYKGEVLGLRWIEWRPSWAWALFSGGVFALAILGLTRISEFLYYQF